MKWVVNIIWKWNLIPPLPLKLEVGAGENIISSAYKKTLQLWMATKNMIR